MVVLDDQLKFPPVSTADENGIVAIGGDLSVPRLLLAYRNGIFPWYSADEPILWWCPDPRFVLFPEALKVSKSMQQVLKRTAFLFTVNQAFNEVIAQCKNIDRPYQDGTWITAPLQKAFANLHALGYAHSAETWLDGKLVGGLYGIRMGNIFFGESMFAKVSNASKFAFIQYVQQLQSVGTVLIDCQVYTEHLESLGASMISRQEFTSLLEQHIPG